MTQIVRGLVANICKSNIGTITQSLMISCGPQISSHRRQRLNEGARGPFDIMILQSGWLSKSRISNIEQNSDISTLEIRYFFFLKTFRFWYRLNTCQPTSNWGIDNENMASLAGLILRLFDWIKNAEIEREIDRDRSSVESSSVRYHTTCK